MTAVLFVVLVAVDLAAPLEASVVFDVAVVLVAAGLAVVVAVVVSLVIAAGLAVVEVVFEVVDVVVVGASSFTGVTGVEGSGIGLLETVATNASIPAVLS